MMRYNPVLIGYPCVRWFVYALAIVLALPFIVRLGNSAQPYNGFDVSNSLIPVEHILPGGPERDSIPAIDAPHFMSNKEVDFLQDQDCVLGLEFPGVARLSIKHPELS